MILRLLLALVFALSCGSVALAKNPKNVLVFFIDDLRPELACYGHSSISSPNIDALAARGILFERAYCQQAICAPSRASFMAGQYPNTLGIFGLGSPLRKTLPDVMSMPRYFQARGYRTSSFGKVYHHQNDDQQFWTDLPAQSSEKYASVETNQKIKKLKKEARRRGITGVKAFGITQGPSVEVADVDDAMYKDGAVADQVVQALGRRGKKPFFMCVGFAKPHLPFAAPKKYWDLYQRDQFEVPARGLPDQTPQLAVTNWGELRAYSDIPQKGPLTDEKTRELMHGYAACVSFSDAQVGKVMAELDRLGLRDDTIVVLWGDHGYKIGEYGLWCKHSNLEIDTRVPFIVSVPGLPQGKRSDALVEMIDVFPTLAELTGGEVPASCEGKSLGSFLASPSDSFRDYVLSQYPHGGSMGYSIRNERWRYTQWLNLKSGKTTETELYDHSKSPLADRNEAQDPQHKKLIAELSEKLNAAGRLKQKR